MAGRVVPNFHVAEVVLDIKFADRVEPAAGIVVASHVLPNRDSSVLRNIASGGDAVEVPNIKFGYERRKRI